MTSKKTILTFGLLISLLGCNRMNNTREHRETSAVTDSTAGNFISSSAAVAGKDSTRKFIRTADVKFKVKNVFNATTFIEDVTVDLGGFVTYTDLNSKIDYTSTIPVSADSSLQSTYFTVSNSMILRVPNTKLDTALKTIAVMIDYLDYRIIKADDVRLQLLANQLTQNRVSKHEQRLTEAINTKGKKLHETSRAEENLVNKQEQSDHAKIASLSLEDRVEFSTINFLIYQRQTVKRELISNNKNIEEYEPGLGTKLSDAFKTGWKILESLLIFITQLWGVILFGGIAYILWKRFRHRLRKK